MIALPSHSPDFNPNEATWAWMRAEIMTPTCFDTAAKVREQIDAFFTQ